MQPAEPPVKGLIFDPMRLVGQLSNQLNKSTITTLDAYPASIPGVERRIIAHPSTERLGNGIVQRAVIAVLVDGRPGSVRKVAAAVQELLDRPISIH